MFQHVYVLFWHTNSIIQFQKIMKYTENWSFWWWYKGHILTLMIMKSGDIYVRIQHCWKDHPDYIIYFDLDLPLTLEIVSRPFLFLCRFPGNMLIADDIFFQKYSFISASNVCSPFTDTWCMASLNTKFKPLRKQLMMSMVATHMYTPSMMVSSRSVTTMISRKWIDPSIVWNKYKTVLV